jgi:hypothetical protein
MTQEFNEGGVSFRYPENWTLEREEADGGWALEALRSEYPELEADSALDMLAGELAVGHDIQFFSLDLANTVWTRCLYGAGGTLLVYWQMNDLELPTMEPVVRAVCASLRVEE